MSPRTARGGSVDARGRLPDEKLLFLLGRKANSSCYSCVNDARKRELPSQQLQRRRLPGRKGKRKKKKTTRIKHKERKGNRGWEAAW